MNQYWINYFIRYKNSTIQDFMKYLYQVALGSGHLISDIQKNYQYLIDEYTHLTYDPHHILIEEISEDLVRVHLEAVKEKDLRIFHQLFMKSVQVDTDISVLLNLFSQVEEGIIEGWIPFELDSWKKEVQTYIKQGCPLISHSSSFKEQYHPHYRLMKKSFVPLIPLLERMNANGTCILAIDGRCGSGKSTLAQFLSDLYGFPIIHMDDFFLQPHQRTSDRLHEVGGNVDYERFLEEVVLPLQQGKDVSYQVFDCHKMQFTSTREISIQKGVIIEGSYAHHPKFEDVATLKIFLDIDEELQKERILKRNGEKMLQRFINEWIPKENAYFDQLDISKNADVHLHNLQIEKP